MKKTNISRLCNDNSGFGAIEAAILIPLMLIILFGVLEFGNYYMRQFAVQSAANSIADYIKAYSPNPGNEVQGAEAAAAKLNNDVKAYAARLNSLVISSGTLANPTMFCGRSKTKIEDAVNNARAACGNDSTNGYGTEGVAVDRYRLNGMFGSGGSSQDEYYVGLAVSVPYKTITGIETIAGINMPEKLTAISVFTVGPVSAKSPSASCTPSQYVTFDSATNSFSCSNFPPSAPIPPGCTGSNQALHWNGSAFLCENLDFQPTISNCSQSAVNGLQWDGSKYNCVVLPSNPPSACNSNTFSNSGNGTAQFVQWNGSNYTCTSINQADLKGKDGANGSNGNHQYVRNVTSDSPGTTDINEGNMSVTTDTSEDVSLTRSFGYNSYCFLSYVAISAFAGTNSCKLNYITHKVPHEHTSLSVRDWTLTAHRPAGGGGTTCYATCIRFFLSNDIYESPGPSEPTEGSGKHNN